MTSTGQGHRETATASGNPAGADGDYLERCLHQVWQQLTAPGFVIVATTLAGHKTAKRGEPGYSGPARKTPDPRAV